LRAALLFLFALSVVATGAHAASQRDWDDCTAFGDPDRAVAGCTRLIADPSESTRNRAIAYANRGLAYDQKGDHDRAIADYDQAIRLDPNNAVVHFQRGYAYYAKGDDDHAIADYDQTIRLEPAYTAAFTSRGLAYRRKGDTDRAAADFRAALASPPPATGDGGEWAHRTAREQLAAIEQTEREERERAEAAERERVRLAAIEEEPERLKQAAMLAEAVKPGVSGRDLERLEKDWEDCRGSETDRVIVGCTRVLADTLEGRAVHAAALVRRGGEYFITGRGGLALRDFKQAVQSDPNVFDDDGFGGPFGFSDFRPFVYSCLGDYERAIRHATEQLRTVPENPSGPFAFMAMFHNRPSLLRVRALALLSNGEFVSALADVEEAIKSSDATVPSALDLLLRGEILRETGALDRAISDYSQAIESERADGLQAIAYFLRAGGQGAKDEQAVADLEAAILVEPTDAEGSVLDFLAGCQPGSALWRIGTFRATAQERLAALAQPEQQPESVAAGFGRRVALVIGNSAYQAVPALANPTRDAAAIAAALRRLGFAEVTHLADLSKQEMERALIEFAEDAQGADWALVYFAGHGLQLGGENYLIPVDAELKRDRHVRLETVSLDDVLEAAGGASALRLVILDSCRNNPFLARMDQTVATRSIGRGLARVEPMAGTMIAFAAKEGQVALDGPGENSPFVTALLRHMDEPGVDIRLMFDQVRDSVMAATNNAQQPFTYSSLPGIELYFRPAE
jgi:tetratricopeptide (TPR) repeat protein